jgi:Na+/H+ antiporter NhaC
MRYIQALLWLGFFGGLAWLVHSGQVANYSGRRGAAFAEMLAGVIDSVGQNVVVIGLVVIGIAVAIWAARGDGDEEDSAAS